MKSEKADALLEEIITYFPELQGRERSIEIEFVSDSFGAKSEIRPSPYSPIRISLRLPYGFDLDLLNTSGMKAVISHELAHYLNPYNPDGLMKKRIPESWWEIWERLKELGEGRCEVRVRK